MRVCVLGAGIVGLASAYVLNNAGYEVVVVDRATAGSGASGGNGCQLSYSYVQPLADPSIWLQLPKLLLSQSSPLKIRPQLDMYQWRWGMQFLAACNTSDARKTTQQLLQLAAESRQAFDTMMLREKLECDFSATGKLVLYENPSLFAKASEQMRVQHSMGCRQEAVSAERCVALEPALVHRRAHIAGAIYTPDECAADGQKVCDGLVSVLQQRGVKFLFETTVSDLQIHNEKVKAANTALGPIQADQFVMALGAAAAPMARSVGVDLPIYPLKGYSITVDVSSQPATAPVVNVTDSDRKVVFARIGQRLRVAGMAELTGYNTRIEPAQIASLCDSTRLLFPGCSDFAQVRGWAGLRPATPNARPLIGQHPKAPQNLLFNVGHGALGFTLAFGSAGRIEALLRKL